MKCMQMLEARLYIDVMVLKVTYFYNHVRTVVWMRKNYGGPRNRIHIASVDAGLRYNTVPFFKTKYILQAIACVFHISATHLG